MRRTEFSIVERHILEGMIRGLNDNKIGKVVGLKRGEVAFFIKLMKRRLNVQTRQQLIDYLHEHIADYISEN